jgi:hypothetical protein
MSKFNLWGRSKFLKSYASPLVGCFPRQNFASAVCILRTRFVGKIRFSTAGTHNRSVKKQRDVAPVNSRQAGHAARVCRMTCTPRRISDAGCEHSAESERRLSPIGGPDPSSCRRVRRGLSTCRICRPRFPSALAPADPARSIFETGAAQASSRGWYRVAHTSGAHRKPAPAANGPMARPPDARPRPGLRGQTDRSQARLQRQPQRPSGRQPLSADALI